MKKPINYTFIVITLALLISGVLFLATLSAPASLQVFGNTSHYLFHQLITIGIGLVLATVAFKIPLRILKKFAIVLFAINILLVIAVFLPGIGSKFLGAKRWVSFGNNSFQPSEFLKITAILYLAAWLSNRSFGQVKNNWLSWAKREWQNIISLYVPFLCLLALVAGLLYLQKDLSTMGIIAIALIVVYFCSQTPLWHTLCTVIVGSLGAALFVFLEPYRMQRFEVFLHPETDPLGIGLQLKQSLIAIGSGGFFGKGLGMSTQKFGFLPQAMTDSIFAILGEETGIIGSSIIIGLFLAFFWQIVRISQKATDTFSKLAAIGIGTWITTQAFVNIASAVGMFPLSGIPLPFFSYGGSHIIAELIGVGILLNISKHA